MEGRCGVKAVSYWDERDMRCGDSRDGPKRDLSECFDIASSRFYNSQA